MPLNVVSKTNSAGKKKPDKEKRHNGTEKVYSTFFGALFFPHKLRISRIGLMKV